MRCYLVVMEAWADGDTQRWQRRVFAEAPCDAALMIGRLLSAAGWEKARIDVRRVVSGCDDVPPILRREDFDR